MLFPTSAKQAVADVFYDKSIDVLAQSEVIDTEGGAVRATGSVQRTFTGNAQFSKLAKIQAEIGLVDQIDIAITCPTDAGVVRDDIIQYQGVKYLVSEAVPRDSHLLIVGRKWPVQ